MTLDDVRDIVFASREPPIHYRMWNIYGAYNLCDLPSPRKLSTNYRDIVTCAGCRAKLLGAAN